MTQKCDGCLYLCKFSMGNYCEMKNRFIADIEQSGGDCINWKRKPKKKQHEEDTWEWVQLEMRIDK